MKRQTEGEGKKEGVTEKERGENCVFWQWSLVWEVYVSAFELKLNICSERLDFSQNW